MSDRNGAVLTQVESQVLPAILNAPWPPPQGQWTYEDWLRLPNDGQRYEVIKGVLYVTPAPTPLHQLISQNLHTLLLAFVQTHRLGWLLYAPVDVYLPGQETPVEPDLIFLATESLTRFKKRGIEGAPDLVVEVLSPRTASYDRKEKKLLYEETGVPEYWLVDPNVRKIEVYGLRNQKYILLGSWGPGEMARSDVLVGFEAAVDEVMPAALLEMLS